MEMDFQTRCTILDGLKALIKEKEREIVKIKERKEEEYNIEKQFAEIANETFSLEEAIRKDVREVEQEIKEIKRKMILIDKDNRILIVPNYVQLHLTVK